MTNNIPSELAFLEENRSFTGSDIRALIILPNDEENLTIISKYLEAIQAIEDGDLTLDEKENIAFRNFKEKAPVENFLPIINLQSITVSTYRNKTQVRALGHVNPRGFALGSRTCAGTMILTEFWRDSFWGLLTQNNDLFDNNIGDAGNSVLVDQIPAFNILLLFANEFGNIAFRYIYGIQIVTSGIVYSIQDMYNENTLSFMCTDVTPLTPIENNLMINALSFRHGVVRDKDRPKINPLSTVRSAKEVVRQFRLRKNARNPLK